MPDTSLALLSWSEQVLQPHTRCSKGSPVGEAPISCYCHLHLPLRTLPARNSPSSLLQSRAIYFGNRFNITTCLGKARPEDMTPPHDSLKPANKDPGSLQACPRFQGSPPSSMHWFAEMLSHGAALFNGQISEVGSPALQAACKQMDWIKPKSMSQRLPKSGPWDYKG